MGLENDAILQAPPAGSGRSAGGFPKGRFLEGHQVKNPCIMLSGSKSKPGFCTSHLSEIKKKKKETNQTETPTNKIKINKP